MPAPVMVMRAPLVPSVRVVPAMHGIVHATAILFAPQGILLRTLEHYAAILTACHAAWHLLTALLRSLTLSCGDFIDAARRDCEHFRSFAVRPAHFSSGLLELRAASRITRESDQKLRR